MVRKSAEAKKTPQRMTQASLFELLAVQEQKDAQAKVQQVQKESKEPKEPKEQKGQKGQGETQKVSKKVTPRKTLLQFGQKLSSFGKLEEIRQRFFR